MFVGPFFFSQTKLNNIFRAFINSNRLVTLSLLGVLTLFEVLDGKLGKKFSSRPVQGILKANGLAVNELDIWVGGIAPGNKGIAVCINMESLQEEVK